MEVSRVSRSISSAEPTRRSRLTHTCKLLMWSSTSVVEPELQNGRKDADWKSYELLDERMSNIARKSMQASIPSHTILRRNALRLIWSSSVNQTQISEKVSMRIFTEDGHAGLEFV